MAPRWQQEVRPGAVGFLGSTGGVTDDGRFIVVARFESEEAARRNSARDEQTASWAETEKVTVSSYPPPAEPALLPRRQCPCRFLPHRAGTPRKLARKQRRHEGVAECEQSG